MKVEVAALGSPSLTVLTVSVDVKQHLETRSTGDCRCTVDGRRRQQGADENLTPLLPKPVFYPG